MDAIEKVPYKPDTTQDIGHFSTRHLSVPCSNCPQLPLASIQKLNTDCEITQKMGNPDDRVTLSLTATGVLDGAK
jgi:hypothetical protein